MKKLADLCKSIGNLDYSKPATKIDQICLRFWYQVVHLFMFG